MSPAAVEVMVASCGAVLAAALIALGVSVRRFSRKAGNFFRDWGGEPARAGVPARPGVMERLATIEVTQTDMKAQIEHVHYELKPNGGYSAKDQLNRLDPAFPPVVLSAGGTG